MKTHSSPVVRTPALVLIAIGFAFLARGYGLNLPERWWALFLFVPAVQYLWPSLQAAIAGEAGAALAGFVPGLAFALLGSALFLDLEWDQVWPFFLIFAGLASITFPRRRTNR